MELAGFSIEQLSLLFSIAVTAGFIDVLAGGGGLITLPALIMTGMPPLSALATNKLQGSMGTATSTYMMLKNKRVEWIDIKPLMMTAFIGSALGTILVQFINTEMLSFVIPIVLLVIAVYFLISPVPKETQGKPKISGRVYKNSIVPFIGCYDGMFGPGAGSFFALSGVSLRGHGLIKATAVAKTLNFSTNIASLIVFLIAGYIVWVVGIVMMSGQLIGAWLGAHCLFKINPRHLRVIVVVMCVGMLVKYASSAVWPGYDL